MELLVSVRTGTGGQLFVIEAQGVVHAVEQARYRIGADREAELAEHLGNLLGGLVSPLQSSDGIAGGVVLQQELDGVD